MKFLLLIALPIVLLSCAGSSPEPDDKKDPKETAPEEPPQPELPVEAAPDPLEFVRPNTTGELMNEDDKKTVTGPAIVTPPEPAPDNAIDVKPPSVPIPVE